MRVNRCTYYRLRNYVPSQRDSENRTLLSKIRKVYNKSKASYGSPRITDELNAQGVDVSRPRVARLMKQAGIRAVRGKKFVVTTDSSHSYPMVENKLNRNFQTQSLGRLTCFSVS